MSSGGEMSISQENMVHFIEQGLPFIERMGLKVVELRKGYSKLMAPLKGNENHVGTIYAGALFTIGEMPGGAIFLSTFDTEKFFPLIKEMNIKFKRLAKTDVTVETFLPEEEAIRIEKEAAEKGKADFVLESEIKDQTGEIVAITRGLYQLRSVGKK